MFKNDNNTGTGTAVDDQPTQPATPTLPPLRTWKVRRVAYGSITDENPYGKLEDLYVSGHGITHADPNGDVIFSRFVFVPGFGVQPIAVRAFSDYYDYEDVTPEPTESLIVH